MKNLLFILFLFLIIGCESNNRSKQMEPINTKAIAPKKAPKFIHACLPDSVYSIKGNFKLKDSAISLPVGDSAFFYDFPKSWDNNIGWTSPPIPGDSISDSLMSRLTQFSGYGEGLIFSNACFKTYLVKKTAPNGFLTKYNLVSVSPNNKLIDTLNLKSYKSLSKENMSLYRFFYIDEDTLIHVKTLGGSHHAEMCFSGVHEKFKILNNGVFAPFYEADLDTGLTEKLVIGKRIIKGQTNNGFPNGQWQQIEFDLNMPYPPKPKRWEYYALSVAEGEYLHGAKVGQWNYYKVKSDTVVADNAYTYAYPKYEKSNTILKTEFYSNGVLINEEVYYDSVNYRPLNANYIGAPKRYTAHLYLNIVGKQYFANYRYGIILREKPKGGEAYRLNYGDTIKITEVDQRLNKDLSYDENLLICDFKANYKGNILHGNTRYFSPFPMPPDTGNQYNTDLDAYASQFPQYVEKQTSTNSYLFKNCDVAEVFLFLQHLKFPIKLHPWLTNTPLVEGFQNACVSKIEIEDELVPGFETKFSADGKLYRITKLEFTFLPQMPYKKALFKQIGQNVLFTIA